MLHTRLKSRGFALFGSNARKLPTISVSCRFTMRIWDLIKDWLGIDGMHPRQWMGLTIKE
jgi:hypothetical protein